MNEEKDHTGPSLIFKKSLSQAMSVARSRSSTEDLKKAAETGLSKCNEEPSEAPSGTTDDIIREGLKNMERLVKMSGSTKVKRSYARGRGRRPSTSPSCVGGGTNSTSAGVVSGKSPGSVNGKSSGAVNEKQQQPFDGKKASDEVSSASAGEACKINQKGTGYAPDKITISDKSAASPTDKNGTGMNETEREAPAKGQPECVAKSCGSVSSGAGVDSTNRQPSRKIEPRPLFPTEGPVPGEKMTGSVSVPNHQTGEINSRHQGNESSKPKRNKGGHRSEKGKHSSKKSVERDKTNKSGGETKDTGKQPVSATKQHTSAEKQHGSAEKQHGSAEKQHGSAEKQHGSAEKQHGSAEKQHGSAEKHGSAVKQHGSAEKQHGSAEKQHQVYNKVAYHGRESRDGMLKGGRKNDGFPPGDPAEKKGFAKGNSYEKMSFCHEDSTHGDSAERKGFPHGDSAERKGFVQSDSADRKGFPYGYSTEKGDFPHQGCADKRCFAAEDSTWKRGFPRDFSQRRGFTQGGFAEKRGFPHEYSAEKRGFAQQDSRFVSQDARVSGQQGSDVFAQQNSKAYAQQDPRAFAQQDSRVSAQQGPRVSAQQDSRVSARQDSGAFSQRDSAEKGRLKVEAAVNPRELHEALNRVIISRMENSMSEHGRTNPKPATNPSVSQPRNNLCEDTASEKSHWSKNSKDQQYQAPPSRTNPPSVKSLLLARRAEAREKFAQLKDAAINVKDEEKIRCSEASSMKGNAYNSSIWDKNQASAFNDRTVDKQAAHISTTTSIKDEVCTSAFKRVSVSCNADNDKHIRSSVDSLHAAAQNVNVDNVASGLETVHISVNEDRNLGTAPHVPCDLLSSADEMDRIEEDDFELDEGLEPSIDSNTSDLHSTKDSVETQYANSYSGFSSDLEPNVNSQSDVSSESHLHDDSQYGFGRQYSSRPYFSHSHGYHNSSYMQPNMPGYSGFGPEAYAPRGERAPYPWWYALFPPRQYRVPVEAIEDDETAEGILNFVQSTLQDIYGYGKEFQNRAPPMATVISIQTVPSYPYGPNYFMQPDSGPEACHYKRNVSQMHGWMPSYPMFPPPPLLPPPPPLPPSARHLMPTPHPSIAGWHEWYSHMYGASRGAGPSPLSADNSHQPYYQRHYGAAGDCPPNFWEQEGRDKWPDPWMFPFYGPGAHFRRDRMASPSSDILKEKGGDTRSGVQSPEPLYDGSIKARQGLYDSISAASAQCDHADEDATATPAGEDRISPASSKGKRSRHPSQPNTSEGCDGSLSKDTSPKPPTKSSKKMNQNLINTSVSYFLNKGMLENSWRRKSSPPESHRLWNKPAPSVVPKAEHNSRESGESEDKNTSSTSPLERGDGLKSHEQNLLPAGNFENPYLRVPQKRPRFVPTMSHFGSTLSPEQKPVSSSPQRGWALKSQNSMPSLQQGANTETRATFTPLTPQSTNSRLRLEQNLHMAEKSRRRSDPVMQSFDSSMSDWRKPPPQTFAGDPMASSAGCDAATSASTGFCRQLQPDSRYSMNPWLRPPVFHSQHFEQWAATFIENSKKYEHKFIDTHCHIDFIYRRLGLDKDLPFVKFREQASNSFPVNFEGCVAVFCEPRIYKDPDEEVDATIKTLMGEKNVWFAIGCHPKQATGFGPRQKFALKKMLLHTKAVALGEIGLDYSRGFDQYADVQKTVFRDQLHIALELRLPLVIHCREADDDCLNIMEEIVPRHHKIHAHCFTRDWTMAQRWLEAFPNLYLGLTPLISYRSAYGAKHTATRVPLNRLLLETDAPYFIPGTASNLPGAPLHSHPGFALFVAQMVAQFQGVTVNEVLKACRENTRAMYGI